MTLWSRHRTIIHFIICFFLEIKDFTDGCGYGYGRLIQYLTVKDFQVVTLSLFLFHKERNCNMEIFYKFSDFQLGIESLIPFQTYLLNIYVSPFV